MKAREGLRVSQTPSVFEGLLWSIIGQQINFPFACLLRSRLIERVGEPLENDLFAPPTASAVAALTVEDLLPLQFSRQKATYLIQTSRLVAAGELDLEKPAPMSATRVERTLLGIRGLGPWSVNYLMMRSLSFADCLPLGDTGVTSGLQGLFVLEERPDRATTQRLMSAFSPFRSWWADGSSLATQPTPSGMKHFFDTFLTPLGDFSVAMDGNGAVVATAFGDEAALCRRFRTDDLVRDSHAVAEPRHEIEEYFAGDRQDFTVRLGAAGTAFQQSVWSALREIPFGATRSYGQLAAFLKEPAPPALSDAPMRPIQSASSCRVIGSSVPTARSQDSLLAKPLSAVC